MTDASLLRRAFAWIFDAGLLFVVYVVASMLIWFVAPDSLRFPIKITESVILDETVETRGDATIRVRDVRTTYFSSKGQLATCLFVVVVSEETEDGKERVSWTKEPLERCKYLERPDFGKLVIGILLLFYAPLMEAGRRQATLGKMALGLHVETVAGDRPSFLRLFARNLAEVLCLATLGFGYAIALFTRRRQALHDLLSGTVVIAR